MRETMERRAKIGKNSRRGLTGIETAIILMAFVIVAAAFSFAVLNVGFQSTQKAQDVIQSGLEKTASAIELDGGVIAKANTAKTKLSEIRFTVKLSAGRQPVDFNKNKMLIALSTGTYFNASIYPYNTTVNCPDNPSSPCADIIALVDSGSNLYLESGDRFEVVVKLPSSGAASIGPNTEFKIELKPVVGGVLTIIKNTPTVLTDTMFLG